MSKVLEKRFTDWRKTQFGTRLIDRLSKRLGIPADRENGHWEHKRSLSTTPLIDYVRGDKQMWIHPALAMSYAMSNPEFQADINVWIYETMTTGVINVHHMKWSQEEYQRGVEMNRDDIREMWG